MTTPNKALVGPRRFQWNAAGWFGSSLGSSAWMLISSCFLAYHNQVGLVLVPVLAFVVVVAASIWLWGRRDRYYPFTAMMVLLGLIAIALPLVWGIVSANASDAAISAMNWPRSIGAFVAVSTIAPILMLWFLFLERSADLNHKLKSSRSHTDVAEQTDEPEPE